jgi:hypothetical protein
MLADEADRQPHAPALVRSGQAFRDGLIERQDVGGGGDARPEPRPELQGPAGRGQGLRVTVFKLQHRGAFDADPRGGGGEVLGPGQPVLGGVEIPEGGRRPGP